MNQEHDYLTEVRKILRRDPRYAIEAYLFLHEALDYTVRRLDRPRHVSGRELLEGIRGIAGEQFGALAPMVFRFWGVRRTEDFGEIVFNLVEAELMGKTETDTRADFRDGYNFDETFRPKK